jgi:hypothetical protein
LTDVGVDVIGQQRLVMLYVLPSAALVTTRAYWFWIEK